MLVRISRSRPACLIPLIALVVGPSTPLASRTPPDARVVAPQGPVRCNRGEQDVRATGIGRMIRKAPVYSNLPAPSPPPMPSHANAQEVVVSAQRVNPTMQNVPMAIATGAGSGAQRAIGTGVIGGMLFGTFLGIFFIPLFFVTVRRRFGGARRAPESAA